MKSVLLTGASGFIGRHCLAPLLSRGYEVHAISSRTARRPLADVHWHIADLLDYSQITELVREVKPAHLLHLAWYAEPGRYWQAPENLRWVQVRERFTSLKNRWQPL